MKSDHNLLRGKIILLIGASSLTKAYIWKHMRSLGVRVVAVDEKDPTEDFEQDYWLHIPLVNPDSVIERVRKFEKVHPEMRLDGAITFIEEYVPLLSSICSEFRFIGNSLEVARNTRSKFAMQELLLKAGRHAIPQKLLESQNDLEEAIVSIGVPAIIKPLLGCNSEYVVLVTSPKEAREVYKYLMRECTSAFHSMYTANAGRFVYQRYIEGPEFSVECVIQNGVARSIGVNEKTAIELPYFVETGDICPARISPEWEHALRAEAETAVHVFGMSNCVSHVELKMASYGPQVIEAASRMGGDDIWSGTQHVYGFDMIEAACKIAVGIPVTIDPHMLCHTVARYIIPERSGRINAIKGIENIKERTVAHCLTKQPGDMVRVPPDGYDFIGWVQVAENSSADADAAIGDVLANVEVEIESTELAKPRSSGEGAVRRALRSRPAARA